jgi:hypothetical protein
MIGRSTMPELVKEIVDRRVDHRFIAEYFLCQHPASCDYSEPGYKYLFYVDPDILS